MLNNCQFIGRLASDPDSKFSASGTQIVSVTISCSEKYKGEETTEWVKIVAFNKLAEIMAQYLTKGSLIFVSGKMQTRSYEDQSGVKKWTTEIIARDMKMLGGGQRNDSTNHQEQEPFGGSSTGDSVPF